jgi:hypothetical protein
MLGNQGRKLEYFMLDEFLDFKPEHVEEICKDIRFAPVCHSLCTVRPILYIFHTLHLLLRGIYKGIFM